jgi:hypothetical protein
MANQGGTARRNVCNRFFNMALTRVRYWVIRRVGGVQHLICRKGTWPIAVVTAAVERDLHELGVKTVAIPRQAATSPARKAAGHARACRKLIKWRTGCEGRISYLKHRYGWDRTRLDGREGAAIWCGHGYSPTTLSRSASWPANPLPSRSCRQPPRCPELSAPTSSGEIVRSDQWLNFRYDTRQR